jgi:hypothetical protein
LPKQKNPASRRDFPCWRLFRPGYWLTIALTGVALPVGILLLLTGLLSAALLLLAGLLTRVLILLSRVVLVLIGHSSISLLNHSARQ